MFGYLDYRVLQNLMKFVFIFQMSGRSSALRGPRRTRVYDCNYNMGESYYKPAIENLDRKYNRE